MIKLNYENTNIKEQDLLAYQDKIMEIENKLINSNDLIGWIDLPTSYDKEEYKKIKQVSNKIQNDSDILIVIGIGGSYLGSRAVIESLTHTFNLSLKTRKYPQVIFAGHNISSNYINDVIDIIKDKDFSINVISKSGTTTEPAIAFRIFKELLEKKYGKEESRKRIYVTTDKEKGILKNISNIEHYETFTIPDDIGGRYSVLTAVGLLPIAVSGINIDNLMKGAKIAQDKYNNQNVLSNDCYKYAILRNILYNQNKKIEILATYEPKLHYLTEWWKQLFGESEGKNNKSLFPAGVDFTTDLHSMGQYIQDGERILIETIIKINNHNNEIIIKNDKDNLDNLNYLENKSLEYINEKAMEGVIKAHVLGNVPNILIELDKLDEENLGELIYFFEKSCAISSSLLGVNPFNQDGVEEYKKNMFILLEKPGYENE